MSLTILNCAGLSCKIPPDSRQKTRLVTLLASVNGIGQVCSERDGPHPDQTQRRRRLCDDAKHTANRRDRLFGATLETDGHQAAGPRSLRDRHSVVDGGPSPCGHSPECRSVPKPEAAFLPHPARGLGGVHVQVADRAEGEAAVVAAASSLGFLEE